MHAYFYTQLRPWLFAMGVCVACAVPVAAQTIYPALELVSLSDAQGNAVYVVDDRIVDIGEVSALEVRYPEAVRDDRYRQHVMVPGFIEHHVHPFLAAISLGSVVISIEDWDLPPGFRPAVRDGPAYRAALAAELSQSAARQDSHDDSERATPNTDLFVTWGYHHYFHGDFNRADLDRLAGDRPAVIFHRSFHELILNSAALQFFNISAADIAAAPASARPFMNLDTGIFAEQGAVAILRKILPNISSHFTRGLQHLSAYLHANGVTMIGNPGAMYDRNLQAAKNAVLGAEATPFRSFFSVNGMYLALAHPEEELVSRTEDIIRNWGGGRVDYLPRQIKLFSDGAMFSQAMQMRRGYLDGHDGAWLMEKEKFTSLFRLYWEAGYQIHVHQTGDAGLDRILDVLDENVHRMPRQDHRTVLVHFGFADPDQILRARDLGAVISANPYYVTALSDLYSGRGIGPHAHNMVPLGDAERAGVPIALHSDMPMAPASPLFLMHQAVNRLNFADHVAAPQQRLSRDTAFRAITENSAYMMRLEADYGTIAVGKFANLTILAENPLTVPAHRIKDIRVIATMVEGQNYPSKGASDEPQ